MFGLSGQKPNYDLFECQKCGSIDIRYFKQGLRCKACRSKGWPVFKYEVLPPHNKEYDPAEQWAFLSVGRWNDKQATLYASKMKRIEKQL